MRAKYPRTPHLPWSPGASSDDVHLADLEAFEGAQVVVTEKLDGENTTIYADGSCHARSLDSGAHPSRTWVKQLAARIASGLPANTRLCGENVFARHSIAYDDLESWFYGLSVWTHDQCWGWPETVALLRGLGIPTPRVLWEGTFDRKAIRNLKVERQRQEGYVVRKVSTFDRAAFRTHVGKWVRPHHVQTDTHWMQAALVPNGLAPTRALWDVRTGLDPDAAALDRLFGDERPLIDLSLPVRGEERLVRVLAGRFAADERRELLPRLAPWSFGRAVADLVGLAPRLHVPMPDERRVGGLVSLGRAVDLRSLLALSRATATGDSVEQVAWSEMAAEDGELLMDPLHHDWVAAVLADSRLDGVRAARVAGAALFARAQGKVRHPGEARALVHPLLTAPCPELTVLVGPSGSGKSTVAKGCAGVNVSLDALREQASAKPVQDGLKQLESALKGGRSAVWDATSLTPSQRALPVGVARRLGAAVRLVSVLTPRSVAERRNQGRARVVPASVVEAQWRRVRWPYAFEADLLEDVLATR